MKIKYGDYKDNFKEVEIPDNTEAIVVDVITGDEVVTYHYRDENGKLEMGRLDHGGRSMDYYDGGYLIDLKAPEDFEEWNNRTSVYGYLYGDYDDEDETN